MRDFICARFQLIRHVFLRPIWLCWVRCFTRLSRLTQKSESSLLTAPAIRLVDEMGHEVSDRYYKLGSSVDITCQVALSFLNTIPSPTTTNSNDKFSSSLTTTTSTERPSTTTIFPFIDMNLIRKTIEQHVPYSGKHNIKWRKDGKDLPKDIKINLRFVRCKQIFFFLYFFLVIAPGLSQSFVRCQL